MSNAAAYFWPCVPEFPRPDLVHAREATLRGRQSHKWICTGRHLCEHVLHELYT